MEDALFLSDGLENLENMPVFLAATSGVCLFLSWADYYFWFEENLLEYFSLAYLNKVEDLAAEVLLG